MTSSQNPITTGLLGLATGDALGVPVEFQSREELDRNPVTDQRGYGTYNQPPGYFSDDSSLAFGLAESLARGTFDLTDQARELVAYKTAAKWTPANQVFDIGLTTSRAIDNLINRLYERQEHLLVTLRDHATEGDNGNGALMRIFPLYAFLRHRSAADWLEHIWLHSALTHGHLRSALCCLLYLRLCHHLLIGAATFGEALTKARRDFTELTREVDDLKPELPHLSVLLTEDFSQRARSQVRGSGYVVQSLEAALWSLFNSTDYRSAVLNAVNLGEDTDTTAAIAGAPAALHYGFDSIPSAWLSQLARRDEIIQLGDRLNETAFH